MTQAGSSQVIATQIDVVLEGTWVIAPYVDASSRIIGVEVYSPACGHPQGVTFSTDLNPIPWPSPASFFMLDNHGHTLNIQRASQSGAGMAVSGIDAGVNHCVKGHRPLSGGWDLKLSIPCGPDVWVSSGTTPTQIVNAQGNTVPCFSGSDAPQGPVSSTQRLTFKNVTGVELCGAPPSVQNMLASQWSKSGVLIFEDEVPYVPTPQHERMAIFAMANLAGLDMLMDYPLPTSRNAPKPPGPIPMNHTGGYCGFSVLLLS